MEEYEAKEKSKRRKPRFGRHVKKDRYTWKHQILRLPFLLFLVLGALIPTLMKNAPASGVEKIYSAAIYPFIAKALSTVSSLFGFSVSEVLIVALAAALILIFLIRFLKLAIGKFGKRHINRVKFISFIISLGIFAGIMLNLFYILWGFNNYRMTLAESMKFEVRARSVDELAYVCEDLADKASALREQTTEDENGIYTIGEHKKAFAGVKEAYENLGARNSLFCIPVHNAKSVFASQALAKMGIAGIYSAYTAEMNVNVYEPDLYILAVAAHETAHYMGFAREDEADFLAFYVSDFSDDVNFKYSAVMHALIGCCNKLYEQDGDRYFNIYNDKFSEKMKNDLDSYREYFDKYKDDPVKTVSDKVNDAYLKHNGQKDGLKSYGNMVDLVLAYYASKGAF